MDDIKILSPGQRIRSIRKQLGIKQEELAGDKFSKNYISMFENNKRKINPINATYLADRINEISKKKEKDIYITASYLLKTESDMATERCNNLFEDVELKYDLDTHDRLKKIYLAIEISKKYSLSNYYGRGMYLLGKISLEKNVYHCAITQFLEALNHFSMFKQKQSVVEAYKMLGITFYLKKDIESSIIYLNLAESNISELSNINRKNDQREQIAYYRALCYYAKEEIYNALLILNEMDSKNEKITTLKNKIKRKLAS